MKKKKKKKGGKKQKQIMTLDRVLGQGKKVTLKLSYFCTPPHPPKKRRGKRWGGNIQSLTGSLEVDSNTRFTHNYSASTAIQVTLPQTMFTFIHLQFALLA